MLFFFFSSRRRHTRFDCDWSSDVCSSDLLVAAHDAELLARQPGQPLPRNTAGLQQINKPIPARADGDLLANAPDEVGSELAGPASHANTLPRVSQPGPAAPAAGGATTAVVPA